MSLRTTAYGLTAFTFAVAFALNDYVTADLPLVWNVTAQIALLTVFAVTFRAARTGEYTADRVDQMVEAATPLLVHAYTTAMLRNYPHLADIRDAATRAATTPEFDEHDPHHLTDTQYEAIRDAFTDVDTRYGLHRPSPVQPRTRLDQIVFIGAIGANVGVAINTVLTDNPDLRASGIVCMFVLAFLAYSTRARRHDDTRDQSLGDDLLHAQYTYAFALVTDPDRLETARGAVIDILRTPDTGRVTDPDSGLTFDSRTAAATHALADLDTTTPPGTPVTPVRNPETDKT